MLISLVKKDFILTKKYVLLLVIFSVAAPIFIASKINFYGKGFCCFFLTVIYLEYILFGTISTIEDKYKGSSLLCTTPYTRCAMVKAKYLFILVIFMCCYFIYTITTYWSPIAMERLNFITFGLSFFITTIYFAVFIPLQYKFGYEKTRYISFGIIFIVPFILANMARMLNYRNYLLGIMDVLPKVIQNLIPLVLALIIGFISMVLSIRIYSKKDL